MKFFIYSIAYRFPATFHVISRNFSYLWDGIREYGCLSLYHSQYIFFLLSLPCSISFSVSMKFFFSVTIVLLFLLYLSLALCLSHISVYISLFFPVSIILSVSVMVKRVGRFNLYMFFCILNLHYRYSTRA